MKVDYDTLFRFFDPVVQGGPSKPIPCDMPRIPPVPDAIPLSKVCALLHLSPPEIDGLRRRLVFPEPARLPILTPFPFFHRRAIFDFGRRKKAILYGLLALDNPKDPTAKDLAATAFKQLELVDQGAVTRALQRAAAVAADEKHLRDATARFQTLR